MKYNLYVINDIAANLSGAPFMARTDEVALRMASLMDFKDIPAKSLSVICIGVYDNEKCKIIGMKKRFVDFVGQRTSNFSKDDLPTSIFTSDLEDKKSVKTE